jgi:hypothetical protein
MQTLEVGSTGVDVESWQSFLNKTGYPVGSVDGIFGVDTKAATEAFQMANKLTPDGIVGNATLAVAIGRGFKPIISRGTPPPRAESYVIAEIAGVHTRGDKPKPVRRRHENPLHCDPGRRVRKGEIGSPNDRARCLDRQKSQGHRSRCRSQRQDRGGIDVSGCGHYGRTDLPFR